MLIQMSIFFIPPPPPPNRKSDQKKRGGSNFWLKWKKYRKKQEKWKHNQLSNLLFTSGHNLRGQIVYFTNTIKNTVNCRINVFSLKKLYQSSLIGSGAR